jgi:hypothetical protein
VEWKRRCTTCHAKRQHQHREDNEDPDRAVPEEETVLFVKDPSGNFRGNIMPLMTFVKTLRLGYWDPGLVIRKAGRLYEVVGDMMEPQTLREVKRC